MGDRMKVAVEDFALHIERNDHGVDLIVTHLDEVVAARGLTFKEFVIVTRDIARLLSLPIYLGDPPSDQGR